MSWFPAGWGLQAVCAELGKVLFFPKVFKVAERWMHWRCHKLRKARGNCNETVAKAHLRACAVGIIITTMKSKVNPRQLAATNLPTALLTTGVTSVLTFIPELGCAVTMGYYQIA